VNPIVAVFLGFLIAEEPLTLRILIATVLVVGSVALITLTQQRFNRSRGTSLKPMGKE
jgi:drug/metabolite transporter (DMT)-like permease